MHTANDAVSLEHNEVSAIAGFNYGTVIALATDNPFSDHETG
jgi:hypothetical protein